MEVRASFGDGEGEIVADSLRSVHEIGSSLRDATDLAVEVAWIWRGIASDIFRDEPGVVRFDDAGEHVAGLGILGALEVVGNVTVAAFADPRADGTFILEIFRNELEGTIDAGEEILSDHSDKLPGEKHAGGRSGVFGEKIAESLDGFNDAGTVESTDDEVSGFGGAEGEFGRFFVTDFTDHDHVGILPKGGTESGGKFIGVRIQFTLREERVLVLEAVFDGVLEGHDVALAGLIEFIESGGESG